MKYRNYFKTRFTFDKKRDIVWKCITKYLQKYVNQNSRVLDVGAGYCTFINNIRAKEKHALDIFESLRSYADKDVRVHIRPSTGMKGIKSGYFDVVFASNFFEHLKREEAYATLNEILRVLKKNGRLIIIQPNFKYAYRNYFDDYTHEMIYSDTSMCDMLKSFKLEIEKCIPRFLPHSIKSRWPKTRLLTTAYLLSPIKPFAKQMLIIARKV